MKAAPSLSDCLREKASARWPEARVATEALKRMTATKTPCWALEKTPMSALKASISMMDPMEPVSRPYWRPAMATMTEIV